MRTERQPGRFRIRVIGPRELGAVRKSSAGEAEGDSSVVSTVSKSPTEWERDLSPFHLGPVPLYTGGQSRCMENAWQYAKVYAEHVGASGEILPQYRLWAEDGWSRPAVRYPMGKGAKPEFMLWGNERLDYVSARKKVYWPLYRDAVRKTRGFERLQELHARGDLSLFDFDGYDHELRKMSLLAVANFAARSMGHAFVLKAMLLYGPDVAIEDLEPDFEQEQERFYGPAPAALQDELF